ncbi:outer membrane beta-barrel protein [Fibrobacter sp. UWP2]|uniref:outer membrane beta-barrel protein n=1 Tax=Fibrobacter sp. UWP2 TaxID=1896216 RepID=UPI0009164562|nr:outer membrane beta-barrel protein [Fibrobacter sp. UWP2]SHI84087.1 hypothetical protein SAMN05720471_10915 [Fibrobacter sp. UWP2]
MKRLLTIAALLCAFTISHADEDEGYWPRSYYINLGFGAVATRGDVNERAISVTDSTGAKSIIYTPAIEIMPMPDITLGVNIRCFSLDIDFQYWNSSNELIDNPEVTEKYTYWRFGFEFMYNFFWPDFFQIGAGIGYSYTNLKTENSAYIGGKIQNSELMGSGFAFITNIHYYITDNFSMVPAIKIYENWFKAVNSKATGTLDLDPYLWQTYVMVSVGLQYQF